jgi:outer membrane lipoprotein LolB
MAVPVAVRRVASGLCLLVLSACASVPPATLDRTVRGETIEGRLAVRYTDPRTGKDDGSSGRFVWTTDRDRLELSLLDPFGQTIALVRSDANTSSITFRDGRRVDGDTPEALTERTLGWTVPLRGLRWWLIGRADPSRPSSTLPDGRLRQDDWAIRFDPAPDGTLPKRIDLTYPGPPAAIELHLIVDERAAS